MLCVGALLRVTPNLKEALTPTLSEPQSHPRESGDRIEVEAIFAHAGLRLKQYLQARFTGADICLLPTGVSNIQIPVEDEGNRTSNLHIIHMGAVWHVAVMPYPGLCAG